MRSVFLICCLRAASGSLPAGRAAASGSVPAARAAASRSLGAEIDAYDLRFRGVRAIYGDVALERFRASHVAIIGVGGVGSWAAEAIARTGFGRITLIDLDEVCISNTNRQLHSLESTVGRPKVEVLKERIGEINPQATVRAIREWLTPETAYGFLESASPPFDAVIEAVDGVADKCAIIAACVALDVPVISTGGAGGKRDATTVRTDDLAFISSDPLLQQVRRQLRSEYGWPPEVKGALYKKSAWGLIGVSSSEPPSAGGPKAESCDSYGTVSHLTGTFGLVAAGAAIDLLVRNEVSDGTRYQKLRERIRSDAGLARRIDPSSGAVEASEAGTAAGSCRLIRPNPSALGLVALDASRDQ